MRNFRRPILAAMLIAALGASTASAATISVNTDRTVTASSKNSTTAAKAATNTTAASQKSAQSIVRPTFPATLPGEVNQKAIREVHFLVPSPATTPLIVGEAAPDTVTIMGAPEATQEQMVAFIEARNKNPKLTCTLGEIVSYYYEEAAREGIRGDVALCQALKETGFFAYGGDVSPTQNNFCGLGATGNKEPGARFATARLGVRAHIQHLLAYASTTAPSEKIVDPRYNHLKKNRPDLFGSVKNWVGLNGRWAVPGKTYGQDILRLWRAAQAPDASAAALVAGNKKVTTAPDEASGYIYRGIAYYSRADYEHAAEDFRTAAELAPDVAEAHYDLALTYERLGKSRDAIRSYDRLLELSPQFAQGYMNKALLELAAKKYDAAIEDFNRSLAAESINAEAYSAIAVAQIAQKKYADAWESLAHAADQNSTNVTVLSNQIIFNSCLK